MVAKISKKMAEMLNEQVELEDFARSNYAAIGSWCNTQGYEGTAKFFFSHASEEETHMFKVIDYINKAGSHGQIPQTKKPKSTYGSYKSIFELALGYEQKVTAHINKLVSLAQKESDHLTFSFLQFFVDEQLEEENLFEKILQKIKLAGTDGRGIFFVDKMLSETK